MTIRQYGRVIRRSWLLILLCAVGGTAMAMLVLLTATPTFSASTQFFVASSGLTAVDDVLRNGSLIQERVPSYVPLVQSATTLGAVSERLGLPADAKIGPEITANNPLGTVLINVEVRDSSAQRAYAIAAALDEVFPRVLQELEQPSGARSPIEVRTVLKPVLPVKPVSPARKVTMALGLLGGLAVGGSIAVLRDRLDTRIDEPEDLEAELGITTLGTVVGAGYRGGGRSLAKNFVRSTPAEDYRQLRTAVQFLAQKRDLRSIVVTTPVEASGAPTVVVNLALAMGVSSGRVLVIDADMRTGGLADLLDSHDSRGLSAVLRGEADPEDVIQHRSEVPFDLLPAGVKAANPSELLGSGAMTTLLAKLAGEYDVVLVHAPPVLSFTDAALLSARPVGTVLVFGRGQTRREHLRRAIDALHAVEAQLLGCVMTSRPGTALHVEDLRERAQPLRSWLQQRWRQPADESRDPTMSDAP